MSIHLFEFRRTLHVFEFQKVHRSKERKNHFEQSARFFVSPDFESGCNQDESVNGVLRLSPPYDHLTLSKLSLARAGQPKHNLGKKNQFLTSQLSSGLFGDHRLEN